MTDDTEIECDADDSTARASDHGDDDDERGDDDRSGPGDGDRGDDDDGDDDDDDHGDRDDDGEDCGTEALTTGREVEEADLKLADGKATFARSSSTEPDRPTSRIGSWSRDLEPIREGLRAAGAGALWIHPGVDLRHLTGLAPLALERPTALVVLADGGLRALAPEHARARAGRDRGRRHRRLERRRRAGGRDRPRAGRRRAPARRRGAPDRRRVRAEGRPARPGDRARPGHPGRPARAQAPRRARAPARGRPPRRRGGRLDRRPRPRRPHRARARAGAHDPLPGRGRRPLRRLRRRHRRPRRAPPPRDGRHADRPRAAAAVRLRLHGRGLPLRHHARPTSRPARDGEVREALRDRPRRPRRRDRRPRARAARRARPTGSPAT